MHSNGLQWAPMQVPVLQVDKVFGNEHDRMGVQGQSVWVRWLCCGQRLNAVARPELARKLPLRARISSLRTVIRMAVSSHFSLGGNLVRAEIIGESRIRILPLRSTRFGHPKRVSEGSRCATRGDRGTMTGSMCEGAE
jgi:hypothetical protein